jgi:pyridoxamine 5'-phosphate oxidase
MSTAATGSHAAGGEPAPWRGLFAEHVAAMQSPEFTLGTIRRVPASSGFGLDDGKGSRITPRARTCVFRGLWASLPVNPKNNAELNPDWYESEMPTFTTDVRMDKIPELWEEAQEAQLPGGAAEAEGGAHDTSAYTGSGGGGPVEAVFWAKEPMVQWRIRGKAYVVGPDIERSDAGKATQAALLQRMRRREEDAGGATAKEGHWSFGREVAAHFGNLSPGMRGSFRNPPPGTPITSGTRDGDGLGLGQKTTDIEDEVARRNFRVVVIVPFEVDQTDLSDPEKPRRWIYRVASGGAAPAADMVSNWEKTEIWP